MRLRTFAIAGLVLFLLLIVYLVQAAKGPGPTCGGLCTGTTPVCDSSGLCIGCSTDADCPGGYCLANGACGVCSSSVPKSCPTGTVCVNGTNCYPCGNNNDCPAGEVCNPTSHTCQQCLVSGDCPKFAPNCSAGVCVQCSKNSDCSPPTQVCGSDGACVVCAADSDCNGGYCVSVSGTAQCTPCVPGDDSRPCTDGSICIDDGSGNGTGQCVQCQGDSGCLEGQTCFADQCWQSCTVQADCAGTPATPNCIGGICTACSTDSDCSGNSPFTHCENGLCVQCTTVGLDQTECPSNVPYCVNNTCEQCSSDANCADVPGQPYCRLVGSGSTNQTYQCVACDGETGCDPTGPTPYCTADNRCVACLSAADCPNGEACNIDGVCVECMQDSDCPTGQWCSNDTGIGGSCVSCRTDGDCDVNSNETYCVNGSCQHCASNANCGGATPYCRSDGGACVACLSDANCSSPTAYCGTSGPDWGTCVGCNTSSDCTSTAAPFCDATTHVCYQCNTNANCANVPGKPYCVQESCVACLTNADCKNPNPICRQGTCAPCTSTCGDCPAGSSCSGGQCVVNPATCWVWKQWNFHQNPNTIPSDYAAGWNTGMGAIGRQNSGSAWMYGWVVLPTNTSPGYTAWNLYGNKAGSDNNSYDDVFTPAEGYVWYLAASPGCRNYLNSGQYVGPPSSGGDTIWFDPDNQIVCVNSLGELSTQHSNHCKYPTDYGPYNLMTTQPVYVCQ